jgi:hypothetical protein
MFKLTRLPLAWIAGLQIPQLDEQKCVCTVPFKYWTKNPFRSVYFAAQSMTAELSTGAIIMVATRVKGKSFSTLVTGTTAVFTKKATGKVYFTCEDTQKALKAVQDSLSSDNPIEVELKTTGRMKDGTVVSEMTFNWSVKARK